MDPCPRVSVYADRPNITHDSRHYSSQYRKLGKQLYIPLLKLELQGGRIPEQPNQNGARIYATLDEWRYHLPIYLETFGLSVLLARYQLSLGDIYLSHKDPFGSAVHASRPVLRLVQ